ASPPTHRVSGSPPPAWANAASRRPSSAVRPTNRELATVPAMAKSMRSTSSDGNRSPARYDPRPGQASDDAPRSPGGSVGCSAEVAASRYPKMPAGRDDSRRIVGQGRVGTTRSRAGVADGRRREGGGNPGHRRGGGRGG